MLKFPCIYQGLIYASTCWPSRHIWLQAPTIICHLKLLRMLYVSYHAPSWWCHDMETRSALLALCSPDRRWIPPTKVQFPDKGLVMQAFDVLFQVSLCMLLNRQSRCRRLRPHDAHMQESYEDYVHVSGFVVFSGSVQFICFQVSGLLNWNLDNHNMIA